LNIIRHKSKEADVKKMLHISIISLFLILAAWFYRGFFYPDAYALKHWPIFVVMASWGAKIGIPVLALLLVVLYIKILKKQIPAINLALLSLSFLLILLIIYPVANTLFQRRHQTKELAAYHPYLQLKPNLPASRMNDGTFTIFCLGGSTTEFKDKQGRGWTDRLEEDLQKEFNTDTIKVYNLGRQWYTTLHTLINYEANLRTLKPDVIIVMHAINDLLHNADFSYLSHGPFRNDYGHFYGPLNRIITEKDLPSLIGKVFDHLWYFKPRQVIDQDAFPGIVPFAGNLNTLIDLAEKDGVKVILMTQPSLYKEGITEQEKEQLRMLNYEAVGPEKQWSYSSVYRGFMLYNLKTSEIAESRHLPLIDLDARIPKTTEYFDDDVHYTVHGFDLVAQQIFQALIDGNLLELAAPRR